VSFDHFFKFESSNNDSGVREHWDGGVIEVSMDGGTWTDVVTFGASLSEPYNGTIEGSNTVLPSRSAFVDTRSSRNLTNNVLTFPRATLTGSALRIRFKIGTDSNTADFGWQIDNFSVTNAAQPMFSEAVVDGNSCASPDAPIVNAGADVLIVSRDDSDINIDLSGTASDPNGDVLTITWQQISGPAVSLTNPDSLTPSFIVNSPSQNTDYLFRLTADDGSETSSDNVMVSINPNQAPEITVSNGTVVEGESFTLNATSSDNEGDSLTYLWSQTAGPTVSLSSTTTLNPSFTAPDVSSSTTLSFELIANDGNIDSLAATANITVTNKTEPVTGGSTSGGGGSLSIYALILLFLTRIRKRSNR